MRQLPPLWTNVFQPICAEISRAVNALGPHQPALLLSVSAVVLATRTVQSTHVGETQSAVVTTRDQTCHSIQYYVFQYSFVIVLVMVLFHFPFV